VDLLPANVQPANVQPANVLVVSTYELGHQPLSVATATASLLAAGHQVRCVDVAVATLSADDVDWADRVALSVPMHTAMRLALRVAGAVRARRPGLPLCFFGLYAGMAGDLTVTSPTDAVVAGEFEAGVVAWAGGGGPGPAVQLGRSEARVPERRLLPELGRYTRLAMAGELRPVGSVAASRGCSHRCRHCPVPVVYDGRVRPVAEDAVVADVDQLVAAGARHISFADPDLLNAPHHARRVVVAVHDRHPNLTFDATIKVEHLLRHRDMLAELAAAGCVFVVSAFESVNDRILGILDKGHTAADMSEAVIALRLHGIEIRPSWLPFTPWTRMDDLVAVVDFVVAHDLIANVDPVQYSVRLLVPDGSLLLAEPSMAAHLTGYDPARLGWTWAHPYPMVDALQAEIAALVEAQAGGDPERTFDEVDRLIRSYAPNAPARPGRGTASLGPRGERARLTEPWFCCSEPTEAQLAPLAPFV
jgi:radical SAM superfamily enzyme YgiQ (UPF0313 family)